MSWIQTHSGRAFEIAAADPEAFCIEDIAHALSQLCRFAGHSRVFYSVAQHSVLVAQHCLPAQALWGLLHDAPEAYLADLPKPLKELPGMQTYRQLEARLTAAIAQRFALQGHDVPAAVKKIDARLLTTEAEQLMAPPPRPWSNPLPAIRGLRIEALPPTEAKRLFLDCYEQLRAAG